MVALLLRLRLSLLAGAFLRRPGEVARSAFAFVAGAAGGVGLVVSMAALVERPATAPIAVLEAVVATVVLLLCGVLMPTGDGLDPRSFRQHGLSAATVSVGTLLGGLLSVPVLLFAAFAIAAAPVLGADAPIGVVSASVVIAVLTVAVGLRYTQAWLRGARRVGMRQRVSAIVGVVVAVLVLVEALLALGGATVHAVAASVADALEWFPLQWMWAAMHQGGGVALALAAGLLVVLVAGWLLLVPRLLRAARDSPAVEDGLGWFAALPSNAFGAIAARTFVYWSRDARYRTSLWVLPIAPLLALVPLLLANAPASVLALVPVPLFALLLGWLPHNDVAYDHSAFWLHVSSAAAGWADRLGRVTPALVLGVPVIVAGSFVAALFAPGDAVAAGSIGVGLALLLTGLGVSSVSSALRPYPAVAPGTSPFRQPQAAGGSGLWPQLIGFVLALAAAWLPVMLLIEAATGVEGAGTAAFWSGLGIGAATLVAGVLLGGAVYERRGPELLAAVQRV